MVGTGVGGAMFEPASADETHAHLPPDEPHARWFLRRFAGAVADTYRTMDPFVAQVVSSPGVLLTATGPDQSTPDDPVPAANPGCSA
jgi:hypothetical protein